MADYSREYAELPNSVVLDEGTELKVIPTETLSPIDEKAGEIFSATLAEPIITAEQVIAAKGAPVLGVVVLAKGPDGEPDRIGFTLTELTVHGGQKVDISTYTNYEFGSPDLAGGNSDTPPVVTAENVLRFQLSEPVEVTYQMDTT